MELSVILTTYNAPSWLEKVVFGYSVQTCRDFELVIADDGSTEETAKQIERCRRETNLPIRHVWHEDRGFRKPEILNKAILAASGDYLIFSDGDCVPRRDFIEQHVRHARKGCMLSGGLVRLPRSLSHQITVDDVLDGRAIDARWLLNGGLPLGRKVMMLPRQRWLGAILDSVTTTRATWNGHNASGWTDDIVRANGYDERMQYGGLDRELGERLVNAGIRPRQIRHRAVCVHLHHRRDYVSASGVQRNLEIRSATREHSFTWTPYGIRKGPELLKVYLGELPTVAPRRRWKQAA